MLFDLTDTCSFFFFSVIVQHLDQFKDQKKDVNWHIESEHCAEMSSKSKVVSGFS